MPIDEALKDTITHYTDRIPDNEIINKMVSSPTYSDLRPTVDYYRQNGLKDNEILDKMMKAPNSGAMQAAQAAPQAPQTEEERLNPTMSALKPGKITGLGGPGTVETPPSQATQAAMGVVNKLPEVGQAVGTAAGMASAAIPGAGAAAPLAIPAGGAAGQVAGRALQSPLTQLLLPKAGAQAPSPSEIGQNAAQGATGGMLSALMMKGTPGGLAAAEPTITPPEQGVAGQTRDYLTRRLLRPGGANPEVAADVVQNVGQQKIPVTQGIQGGPSVIQQNIRNWSGKVDELIGEAQDKLKSYQGPYMAGTGSPERAGKVDIHAIIQPMFDVSDAYANAGLKAESEAVMKQADEFLALPRYQDPETAQSIKKLVYSTISDPAWQQSAGGSGGTAARKQFSTGIAGQLEDIAPGVKEANQQIGQAIQMRPFVSKATERVENETVKNRLIAGGLEKGRDLSSDLVAKLSKSYAGRNAEPGTLDEMLGANPTTFVANQAMRPFNQNEEEPNLTNLLNKGKKSYGK